jgi:hypothetical protein
MLNGSPGTSLNYLPNTINDVGRLVLCYVIGNELVCSRDIVRLMLAPSLGYWGAIVVAHSREGGKKTGEKGH